MIGRMVSRTEFTGSWIIVLVLSVIFLPLGIIYYFMSRETVTEPAGYKGPSLKQQRLQNSLQKFSDWANPKLADLWNRWKNRNLEKEDR